MGRCSGWDVSVDRVCDVCLCELKWALKDVVKGIAVKAGSALILNVSCLISQSRVLVFVFLEGGHCDVTSFYCSSFISLFQMCLVTDTVQIHIPLTAVGFM